MLFETTVALPLQDFPVVGDFVRFRNEITALNGTRTGDFIADSGRTGTYSYVNPGQEVLDFYDRRLVLVFDDLSPNLILLLNYFEEVEAALNNRRVVFGHLSLPGAIGDVYGTDAQFAVI